MPNIDYSGPHGGLLAIAFGAGWMVATALWLAVGGVIWRYFIEPRIKTLEADRQRLEARVGQLETMLMLHGPQELRRAMQAVASEAHTEVHELRRAVKGKTDGA